MQVQVKPTFYQSFGGINFMEDGLRRMAFEEIINRYLGERPPQAVYSYADVFKSLFYMFSIGGSVLDDLNTLRHQMQDHPGFRACSPDTVEYVCRGLKQSSKEVLSEKAVKHLINEHADFNRLLPALSVWGGVLHSKDSYTMDYDGHILPNAKPDNACTYKQSEGYYPVVCSINKLPVYVQNRNGNTPESYGQISVLKKAIEQCTTQQIRVKKFRADASCYEKDTLDYLEKEGIHYFIRAEMSRGLRLALQDENEWQDAHLNYRKVQVCSLQEKVLGRDRRLVAYRYRAEGQLSIDDMDGYRYYALVTNDEEAAPLSCIEFYNQRGCAGEHHFKELDNDFGWSKLPFDNMEMNTVYLYATAVAYLLFNICKHRYAGQVSFVKPCMRLKGFILHFVTLTAKWIKTGRRFVLKIFTPKDYSPLFAT